MSYSISSEKFTHPLLKPILLELNEYFKEAGISFFVIGATARDIIMELHDAKSGRLTYDLDIAITVNHWEQWLKVEEEILKLENFTKDKDQRQRFLYKEKFQLDIVPFGEIMKSDHKIFWPPNEELAMSVLGFTAANEAALPVRIDDETEIKIATLSGIFILKITAWKDRHQRNNKDADDMGFILENYLSIHEERAAAKYYDEVYGQEPFKDTTAGAVLLGKDIQELLENHMETVESILEILRGELEKEEESKLINQIIETHKSLSYEEVLQSIQNIVNGLNQK
ncbi:nucleotidyl transferase AbiEii/AbiGii toxin family protein [Autumnicola edwardsiae]|uniref:Nucleotidyl transferase AbiEii/AbiGii toxin family protein n=1 Tax=Autumnicola edwardsiae TaxID=3075594 RepID=A0ABU3CUD8_9FLAO|nr:nucleotidyl transferase AbiEii/AbiGii toxin family protein [Zunongwangia sp. F297]MDT0649901.1 nucleotidyl transferase AbiEii/AbiGii toxin family protein [Zunongwangia sp. F297]